MWWPDTQDAMRRLAGSEQAAGLPALNTIYVDSAAVAVGGGKRVIYLVVATALAWVSAGQATWQPYAAQSAQAAAGGAASQVDGTHIVGALLGAAQNLGAAASTSLPAGLYRLSPGTVAELQYPDRFVGVELKFPSALTGGVASVYVESCA